MPPLRDEQAITLVKVTVPRFDQFAQIVGVPVLVGIASLAFGNVAKVRGG